MIERLVKTLRIWKEADARLRTLAAAKTLADDEIRALRARCEDLQVALTDAQHDSVRSREMVADWISMRTYGVPIYSQANVLPPPHEESAAVPRKVRARDLVFQAEQEMAATMLMQMAAKGTIDDSRTASATT